uniref:NAC domain-containing protein n=1 Tax=Brassica oleracea var. oleracea TaxID=109376 RepID=A0A0D3C721_BRAOL
MVNPVGLRFLPTEEEIVDHYLRLKNHGGSNTSHVDQVISTINICNFDPWELPLPYFFVHSQGSRRWSQKIRFGISSEVQNPNQITSSVSLIPHVNSSSEGLSTEAEVEYRDRGGMSHQITSSISSIPHVNNNNSGVLSTETEVDPRLFSGFLYLEEDAHFEDETLRDLNSLPNNDDAEEEEWLVNLWSMQGDRNDHRPKMPLTGFISDDDDDDDSDSDSISTKTVPPHKKLKVLFHMIWQCSIKSSSTCVTFGNSNRLIDQIIDLPESPRSTIESVSLTQEVSKALGANSAISEKKMSPCDDDAQVSEIGGDQMGQEMVIKNKRAGFIYRMIQKFAKKIKLCSCVSRI